MQLVSNDSCSFSVQSIFIIPLRLNQSHLKASFMVHLICCPSSFDCTGSEDTVQHCRGRPQLLSHYSLKAILPAKKCGWWVKRKVLCFIYFIVLFCEPNTPPGDRLAYSDLHCMEIIYNEWQKKALVLKLYIPSAFSYILWPLKHTWTKFKTSIKQCYAQQPIKTCLNTIKQQ